MVRKTHITTMATLVLLVVGQIQASPSELIQNGDFETGDLQTDLATVVKWTYIAIGSPPGHWFSHPAGISTAPVSGYPVNFTGPGSYGTKIALFDTMGDVGGGGTNTTLFQAFAVTEPMTSVVLSFDMFVNDWSNRGPDTTPPTTQFGYVGLYPDGGTFPPVPPDPASDLTTLYLGVDSGSDPNPFTHYAFDITSSVGAVGDYNLVFGASAEYAGVLTMGIDNVSILAQPVPVPGALLLGGIGTGLITWLRRRRVL